uniref:Transposase n=1 Tax=Steinernema glaseri TaxID=37863 RepID=A0A1I7Z7R9_9BILA
MLFVSSARSLSASPSRPPPRLPSRSLPRSVDGPCMEQGLHRSVPWHCERRFRPSVRHLARFVLPRLLGICPTRRTAMIATVMISSIGPPRGPYPTRSRRRRRQHLTGCGRSEQIAAETAGLLTRRRRPSSPSARACLLAITAHCRLPYLHS